MRDIPLNPVGDDAYLQPSPASFPRDTPVTDPAFSGADQSYEFPSLGGDFGPARVQVLSGPLDGGEAGLSVTPTLRPVPPNIPTPPIVFVGRAGNDASRLNLYPWFKTPPEGLDMNNPNPLPAPPPPAPPVDPPGVTVVVNPLSVNQGVAVFSSPALRNATVTLDYALNGGATQQVVIMVLAGDTASQVAAKVRAAIDAVFGLDASGTGGTVNIVGLGGTLTAYNITIT